MILASRTTCHLVAGILLILVGGLGDASGQTGAVLYAFGSFPTDGVYPLTGLVQGTDGNFYGTTYQGGTSNFGTVFRISPDGNYSNLYSFGSLPGDGRTPLAGLVQGSDGYFYGTTAFGGSNTNYYSGAGTVFRISPSGSYTNLYSFSGSPNDGDEPGGLVQGSDGWLYGTTGFGGTNNAGTVFRISPSGSYTNLYSFAGPVNYDEDPLLAAASLVQGGDGNFYGTTDSGGTNGLGTVFRISPGGSYTTLYSFVGYPTDGGNPQAGLVQGSDGNFYGTTEYSVYRIIPNGSFTNLYFFPDYVGNDVLTLAGLVQGSDGNFYGTAYKGGTSSVGTVFRISPSGSYTTLYSFADYPDGADPSAGLRQGCDGNFYGTTQYGGSSDVNRFGVHGYGTVFKLTVPLNSPANQISAIQIVGNDVAIGIPSVAYETYQLQFSSSMNPTNWVNEGGTITSIGALLTLTNFGGAVAPQGFYRFAITP
jgi:uncharacterized repeat protein (TIGR03803 family)